MNKYLNQLVELSDIDKKIDSYEPKIKQIREDLDTKLAQKFELEKKIEANSEHLESNELAKRKNELHLKELSEKIKDLGKKSAAVKTDKEMKALQLEEEIAKEQIDFANEEIERLDKIKGLKEEDNESLKQEISDMSDGIIALEKATNKELQKLEKERISVYDGKQKLLSDMNQNIIVFYEKIRRWAGNTTVVPVKKQACYGCYMRLNNHTYSSVLLAKEITTCPHCGRILYMDKVELENEENIEESAS